MACFRVLSDRLFKDTHVFPTIQLHQHCIASAFIFHKMCMKPSCFVRLQHPQPVLLTTQDPALKHILKWTLYVLQQIILRTYKCFVWIYKCPKRCWLDRCPVGLQQRLYIPWYVFRFQVIGIHRETEKGNIWMRLTSNEYQCHFFEP